MGYRDPFSIKNQRGLLFLSDCFGNSVSDAGSTMLFPERCLDLPGADSLASMPFLAGFIYIFSDERKNQEISVYWSPVNMELLGSRQGLGGCFLRQKLICLDAMKAKILQVVRFNIYPKP